MSRLHVGAALWAAWLLGPDDGPEEAALWTAWLDWAQDNMDIRGGASVMGTEQL